MGLKNLFLNVLTSDIKGKDLATTYKIMLLNAFLIFGALSMGFTLIYRLLHPISYSFIIIDICTSSSFVIAFIYLRKTKNIEVAGLFSSFVIVVFMWAFVYHNRAYSLGLVWTYMVPIYVIFLNGYKKGGILTGLFYVGFLFVYSIGEEQWIKEGWNSLSFIRYVLTSAVLVSICLAYDYIFSKFQQKLHEESHTDTLTKLYNRRKIDEVLSHEIQKQKRVFTNLSFAIFDIDNFKSVNDEFGHLQGDRVLQELASIVNSSIRINDVAGRWGGEEFCVVSQDTSLNEAIVLFERLRTNIKNHDFGIKRELTCSFGVSCLGKDFDAQKLVSQADNLLYKAKNSGKDVVCFGGRGEG